MDAYIEACLKKVNDMVNNAAREYTSSKVKADHIARAVNAIDALKSAVKTLN